MTLKDQYDQGTYLGRLYHFSALTDPRNLLVTDSELQQAQALVKETNPNPKDYYQAKKLVDSSIHPDTGNPILLPFRMASFVPTNVPIIAFMLIPNPTIGMIVFGQWLNQSVNVCFNHFNANKTTPMSVTETAMAYTAAVSSSCAIALGLDSAVKRANLSPGVRSILGRVVPFVAVSTAGTLNVFLMRRKELMYALPDLDTESGVKIPWDLPWATARRLDGALLARLRYLA